MGWGRSTCIRPTPSALAGTAQAEELAPTIARAEELVREREQLEAERKRILAEGADGPEAEDLAARLADFSARSEAFDQEFREQGVQEKVEDLKKRGGFVNTVGLIYAILGFWVSQIVAGALAAKAARR